nr:MAG TPA: hypothetical protein [Caudoviricetes sp.]
MFGSPEQPERKACGRKLNKIICNGRHISNKSPRKSFDDLCSILLLMKNPQEAAAEL